MKLEVNLPTTLTISDDHELYDLQDHLEAIISKIKVRELGYYLDGYMIFVYLGNLKSPENASMLKFALAKINIAEDYRRTI